MNWKQPIPTSIKEFDTVTKLIAMSILIDSRNSDMVTPKEFWHGNKRYLLKLKKGQCVFAKARFIEETGIPRCRVDRSLRILIEQNSTIQIATVPMPFGLIITVLNYDEISGMTTETASERQANDKRMTSEQLTSKESDKSDKSEKEKKVNQKKDFENPIKLTEDETVKTITSLFEGKEKIVSESLIEIVKVFYQHRLAINKPLNNLMIKTFANKWVNYPDEVIIEAISRTVESGQWAGVFFEFYDKGSLTKKPESNEPTVQDIHDKYNITF